MVLQTIWFYLWGLLWAIFFITDGFDFGVGMLFPFLGKKEEDKQLMLHSIGPFWDGNEVWLLTAGGVTFAAFPLVYAVMFSSLYSALMLILFALIVRGVALEFRNKVQHPGWKKLWDTCFFVGSAAPALLFGVAFANIFQGIPFDGAGLYHGTLLTLLNPYGIAGGLLFVLMFLLHGSVWLALKTDDDLQRKATLVAEAVWLALLIMAVVFLIASWFVTQLYANYLAYPMLFSVVLLTVLALLAVRLLIARQAYFKAWIASAVTIFGTTAFGVIGLFPNLFPSSIDPAFSLTAFNASSSPMTLTIMLVVALIFVPIVLIYQLWAYRLFQGKPTLQELMSEEAY